MNEREQAFAKAFEEWERRYRENPDEFNDATADMDAATLAERRARYFAQILDGQ
jgi:hypothetical protein